MSDISGEGDLDSSQVESWSVGSEVTGRKWRGASRISLLGVIPENKNKKLILL